MSRDLAEPEIRFARVAWLYIKKRSLNPPNFSRHEYSAERAASASPIWICVERFSKASVQEGGMMAAPEILSPHGKNTTQPTVRRDESKAASL